LSSGMYRQFWTPYSPPWEIEISQKEFLQNRLTYIKEDRPLICTDDLLRAARFVIIQTGTIFMCVCVYVRTYVCGFIYYVYAKETQKYIHKQSNVISINFSWIMGKNKRIIWK
jgi:hypothetical protein